MLCVFLLNDAHPLFIASQVERASHTQIRKQGVFFWKSGIVVKALSDDWYMVRIQGRAVDAETPSSPEEDEL